MPVLPIVVAAALALGIVLVTVALTSRASVDPVQARLTQLGSMQAKNLEELELQQPFFDRTIRPLADGLSAALSRRSSSSFTDKTEKRLAMAGNPGGLRVGDFLVAKAVCAVIFAILFFLAPAG